MSLNLTDKKGLCIAAFWVVITNRNFLMNSLSSGWYNQLQEEGLHFYFFLIYSGNNPEVAKFPLLWLQQGRHSHRNFPIYTVQVFHWRSLILINGQHNLLIFFSESFFLTATSRLCLSSFLGRLVKWGWAFSCNKFMMLLLCFRVAGVIYFFVVQEIKRTRFYL